MSNGSEHIPEKVPTAFGMVTPAFVPDQWMAKLQQSWAERQERMIRHSYILQGIDPDNRPTIQVKQPLPAEFLAARAEFEKRWDAIIQEGEDKRFLDLGPDGDRWVTTDTERWVSVPNPDFDPDKPNPYAERLAEGDGVIIPVIQRDALHLGGDRAQAD